MEFLMAAGTEGPPKGKKKKTFLLKLNMAFINSTKRGQPRLFLKSPWLQENATQF